MNIRTTLAALALTTSLAVADDFPAFKDVAKEYVKVVSTADGAKPLYTIYHRSRDHQLLAELPRQFEGKNIYIVPTVAGGDEQMGVYSIWHHLIGQGARLNYWKRYDRKLALIEPNLNFRSTGDAESQKATKRVYTDRVILSTPILCMGPGGGPVIDLDQVLLGQSGAFFGGFTRGADVSLATVESVKAFPYNIEVTFSLPRAGGRLASIHYSIGAPPKSKGFKPRLADRRVGFYYTDFTDRSRNDGESQKTRYIHRWNLEKRDPSLRLSPPRQPVTYYIEHTTPVRYRRWVREGILAWNKAFEQVGIVDAIEVHQQDAQTGAHMEKDPEDLRYSFIRWTNAHMGFAIGPIHVHPETGEIYEADVVLDESFVGGWANSVFAAELASAAMQGFDGETVSWLQDNPRWDPRVRLASPRYRGDAEAFGTRLREGTADASDAPPTFAPWVWRETDAQTAARGGICACMRHQAREVATVRLAMKAGTLTGFEGDELIDGLPESFVANMLKALVMHEVGHTLGLMHNWRGSSMHSYAEINSDSFNGKPMASTVMDYQPTNIVVPDGELTQGDWDMTDIGAYDLWAIKWGYTDGDPNEIIALAGHHGHAFSSEEGQMGPDPRAKTWDIGSNSLDMADAQIEFVRHLRAQILDKVVEDGDSWEKARDSFSNLLMRQMMMMSMASHWVGGAYTSKLHKGDEFAENPITPVEVDQQRRAVKFILENGFRDEVFGITPDILARLGIDQWYDEGWGDPQDWHVHDQILGVQAAAMTMLVNPMRMRRIIDNEMRLAPEDDALTAPELLETIRDEVWRELDTRLTRRFTERKPMISSLRRHLQREHLDRLIDLATGRTWNSASGATVATLSRQELREIAKLISSANGRTGLDAYTKAHLMDSHERIERALEAAYLRRD